MLFRFIFSHPLKNCLGAIVSPEYEGIFPERTDGQIKYLITK